MTGPRMMAAVISSSIYCKACIVEIIIWYPRYKDMKRKHRNITICCKNLCCALNVVVNIHDAL